MGNFEKAIKIVLGFEGGFSDHPLDTGGKTKYGITEGTLKSAQKEGIVSNSTTIYSLTVEEAKKIYKKKYWDKVKGDSLPWPLCLILFDCAVNHGPGRAVKLLQKSMNSFLKKKIAVDGGFGPITFSALKLMLERNDMWNNFSEKLEKDILLKALCTEVLLNRVEFYDAIVQKRPSQKVFLKGWIHHRVVKLREKAGLENG